MKWGTLDIAMTTNPAPPSNQTEIPGNGPRPWYRHLLHARVLLTLILTGLIYVMFFAFGIYIFFFAR
ncbi:hypothetical protein TSACC_22033 [Terrimicrobium sacchariphilum]|uniref:Uncharacterized protein n=2 Tax=Terrimicrobium sacchariphilum TaxID=690879 RepID=A0A146GAL2_TERSA|nr:hypothetical protein TSACC_22033 [Terrimicrobium sacchariphilum]